jgi:hypothetical protein
MTPAPIHAKLTPQVFRLASNAVEMFSPESPPKLTP